MVAPFDVYSVAEGGVEEPGVYIVENVDQRVTACV